MCRPRRNIRSVIGKVDVDNTVAVATQDGQHLRCPRNDSCRFVANLQVLLIRVSDPDRNWRISRNVFVHALSDVSGL